jgi:hypothetical protein
MLKGLIFVLDKVGQAVGKPLIWASRATWSKGTKMIVMALLRRKLPKGLKNLPDNMVDKIANAVTNMSPELEKQFLQALVRNVDLLSKPQVFTDRLQRLIVLIPQRSEKIRQLNVKLLKLTTGVGKNRILPTEANRKLLTAEIKKLEGSLNASLKAAETLVHDAYLLRYINPKFIFPDLKKSQGLVEKYLRKVPLKVGLTTIENNTLFNGAKAVGLALINKPILKM